MRMEEVSPPINLFLIESAAPVKMHSCFLDLSLDYRRVPLGLVEGLDVRKRRAHWRANQQLGLLLVQDVSPPSIELGR